MKKAIDIFSGMGLLVLLSGSGLGFWLALKDIKTISASNDNIMQMLMAMFLFTIALYISSSMIKAKGK